MCYFFISAIRGKCNSSCWGIPWRCHEIRCLVSALRSDVFCGTSVSQLVSHSGSHRNCCLRRDAGSILFYCLSREHRRATSGNELDPSCSGRRYLGWGSRGCVDFLRRDESYGADCSTHHDCRSPVVGSCGHDVYPQHLRFLLAGDNSPLASSSGFFLFHTKTRSISFIIFPIFPQYRVPSLSTRGSINERKSLFEGFFHF